MTDRSFDGARRREFLRSSALGVAGTALLRGQQEANRRPLKVGIVGVGLRGTFHGETLVRLAKAGEPVEIAAVCDIYQPRLERAEVKFQAKGFRNTTDMLREMQLDAVMIATPDRHHLYNLREALRAGKDVYVEKPLCHWEQFDLLKSVVHENRKLKRIVQIGSQYLSDPIWEKGAELVKSGVIGKPAHVQIPNFRNTDVGERAMMVIDDPNAIDGRGVDWAKFQADAPKRDFSITRLFQWRLFMEYSGGPLTDTGPHEMCTVFKMLQPGFPTKVMATGGRFHWNHERTVPDTMDVLMQYPQGMTIALLETYVNNAFPIEKVIRGAEGTVHLTNDGFEIYPLQRTSLGQQRPKENPAATHKLVTERAAAISAGAAPSALSEPTALLMKNFLDSVRTRQQPRFDLELGYIVQIPLCMAMRSLLESKVALFDAGREEIRMS